ncbi:hypothetical protein DEJ50_20455 [Streptomyces venezuelae]|uniref:LPXTG cell wall anchor domain-containing protein n=1 Tax=Streptomyces venezuelae TaxID=54571 RepID=A0A5P2D5K4_STRVZ|nr:hypothetical protein [Streptomyces venezuelae]QES49840.1 hypothetical protein DEJ50_20455 [Streptomyces venezuelae]
MSARRPLLTALGATTLLGALWFVPSANATAPERSGPPVGPVNAAAPAEVLTLRGAGPGSGSTPAHLALAETTGVDTTPFVFAGIACLGTGAGFWVFSARRSRAA